jgi:hypothetical protein
VGTFSIGNLLRRKLKLSANGSICAIGAGGTGTEQQNNAKLQLLLDMVLKGNEQKVVNSVNIKHQWPGWKEYYSPTATNARALGASCWINRKRQLK